MHGIKSPKLQRYGVMVAGVEAFTNLAESKVNL